MQASRRGALASTVNTVKRDIEEICQSGNFYVTEEIGNELNVIANGLDHLKLDDYLLATSKDWDKGFDQTQTQSHKAKAVSVLDSAAAVLYDYKDKMGNVAISRCQENEIRELHHWAVQNLRNVQKELAPFTHGAADRIKQFGDHIGVTDRYTGYRNNLTRGTRDLFKLGTSWMDKSTKGGRLLNGLSRSTSFAETAAPQRATSASAVRFGTTQPSRVDTKGYQTIDTLFPRSRTMYPENFAAKSLALSDLKTANAMNATLSSGKVGDITTQACGPNNLSVQEQAGINTTFPGRTEYMTRYKLPPYNVKTSHFTINPTPDFKLHGRPLGLTTYTPSFTEYQVRYEWPDGNKIVKLPWRRK